MRLGQEGVYISLPIITKKPKTNADRIRSMTDGEMAVWIAETSNCSDWCILNEQCKTKPDNCSCINVWLNWLKEEISDENSKRKLT